MRFSGSSGKGGNKWEKVVIAGRQFEKIPKATWNAEFRLFASTLDEDLKGEPEPGPDEYVLWPVYEPDDHLEFPSKPEPEVVGPLARSGMASHTIYDGEPPMFPRDTPEYLQALHDDPPRNSAPVPNGFSARQLQVFSEMDWFGEVGMVLVENGWSDWFTATPDLLRRLELAAPGTAEAAKDVYGENWAYFAMEVAAVYLCPPLSRLWYAANLMSLYYCHHDDVRFGYLLAEYRLRMKWETHALKHQKIVENNRENGTRGGQAAVGAKRRQILNDLADNNPSMFQRVLPATAARNARSLAVQYDIETGEGLFARKGEILKLDWFERWYADYCLNAPKG